MKKLLMLGGGFLQTYVIKEAKKCGYYVLVLDCDPSAMGYAYAERNHHKGKYPLIWMNALDNEKNRYRQKHKSHIEVGQHVNPVVLKLRYCKNNINNDKYD